LIPLCASHEKNTSLYLKDDRVEAAKKCSGNIFFFSAIEKLCCYFATNE